MIQTSLTQAWGLRYPILSAPMSPYAGPELALAVTEAGGLGMLAVGNAETADAIAAKAGPLRLSGARFGIGLQVWSIHGRDDIAEAVIAARPFAVSLSFGDIAAHAPRFAAAGIRVVSQVQSVALARAAEAAGAEVVIAQGTESGGHTGTVGTLPLLQAILEAVRVPVIAAGGIASGRGLAAVLAAGAQGAWIGTPFLAAKEARVPEAARAKILESDETQTVLTSVFDRVRGIPWPAQFRGRALQNDFSRRWEGREEQLLGDTGAREGFERASKAGNYSIAGIYAGQSVGMTNALADAAGIVRAIGEGAEAQLREVTALLT